MKFFVIISFLAVNAYAARLDNQYIPPPPNAHSAGGTNLEAPRQALPSNIQASFTSPGGVQTQYQQQQVNRPGLNQGTFTSHSHGNGFQSVSAGSFSSNAGQPQPQRFAPAPQQTYQHASTSYQQPAQPSRPAYQAPSSYQPAQPQQQYNYQQSGYNQASTTPIPILKCELYILLLLLFRNLFLIIYDDCELKIDKLVSHQSNNNDLWIVIKMKSY